MWFWRLVGCLRGRLDHFVVSWASRESSGIDGDEVVLVGRFASQECNPCRQHRDAAEEYQRPETIQLRRISFSPSTPYNQATNRKKNQGGYHSCFILDQPSDLL